MSGAPPLRAGARDIARQARELLQRVGESRWPGFEAPAAPAASAPAARARGTVAPSPVTPLPAGAWESLEAVAAAVAGCAKCPLHETRTRTVPGEGNPRARLMFVGEAPGANEDAQGRPFVGAAGQLLDKMIAAMGLARGEVFIANVLKCRPPGNRDPQPHEVAACLPYLQGQFALIRPEAICALGRHAAHALLGTSASLGSLRERFHDYHGTPLLATYHPSYLLQRPEEKTKAWKDLQLVMQRLGLRAPGPRQNAGGAP